MKKTLVLTSNAPRHIYFANILSQSLNVVGIVSEPKNDYFEVQREQSRLVGNHFSALTMYENKYVGGFLSFPNTPIICIDKCKINDAEVLNWAKEKNPDYICMFGTGILSDTWLSEYKGRVFNLHLGYSPRYRGSATLFWPFFNDELEFVGVTIHLAESRVDAGAIIKVLTPNINAGDNYYDITYKAIKEGVDEFSDVIKGFIAGTLKAAEQKKKIKSISIRKKIFLRMH